MPRADTEANATTTVIAGLRNRLARAEIAGHPAVQDELRKPEELLMILLDQSEHKPRRRPLSIHGNRQLARLRTGHPNVLLNGEYRCVAAAWQITGSASWLKD